jgi:hypothetical protein
VNTKMAQPGVPMAEVPMEIDGIAH